MPSAFDFSDRVAIVTGGASGIGLATAELLLASHAKVFAVDMSPLAEQSLLDAGSKSPSAFAFHQADLTEPGAAEAIVAKCQERFGPKIDVLANVAGIIDDFTAADQVSDKILDRVLEVNLKAPIRLMRHVLPVMVQGGGGAIVNVSSKAGQSGACAGIAYTASKHGLIGATSQTAWQFRDRNVRCNAVAPGGVDTNMAKTATAASINIESYMRAKASIDVGMGSKSLAAKDIANSIVFLASDLSSEISGVVLPVDRAWSTV